MTRTYVRLLKGLVDGYNAGTEPGETSASVGGAAAVDGREIRSSKFGLLNSKILRSEEVGSDLEQLCPWTFLPSK